MNNLPAGGNIPIGTKDTIKVTASWLPENLAIEAYAFVLNNTGQVRSHDDFICQQRLSSKDGFMVLSTSSGKAVFHIDLRKIPQDIEKIVFAVTTEKSLAELFDLSIEVDSLAHFSPDYGAMQALILGELYLRNQQWKFKAVGQGFKEGLEFLKNRYGVSLETEVPPALIQAAVKTGMPEENLAMTRENASEAATPTARREPRSFIATRLKLITDLSKLWIVYSLLIFIAVELLLAGLLGHLIFSRFVPHTLMYTLEVILMLSSFFVGAALVGFISTEVRILEPAIAAFLFVLITLAISLFSPYSFMVFTWTKALIGGGIAFCLAWMGASLGEKLEAKIGNKASREFFEND